MTLRISGHSSTFDLVFFVLKSPGIWRQMGCEKFAVFTLKHWSHVRIFHILNMCYLLQVVE